MNFKESLANLKARFQCFMCRKKHYCLLRGVQDRKICNKLHIRNHTNLHKDCYKRKK